MCRNSSNHNEHTPAGSNSKTCRSKIVGWFNMVSDWLDKHPYSAGIAELGIIILFIAFTYCSISSTKYSQLLFGIVAVICACGVYWMHIHWTYCHLCRETKPDAIKRIQKAESFRKYVRFLVYLAAICLVINSNWLQIGVTRWLDCVVKNYVAIKATGLIVLSLTLLLTFFETLSRQTFRKWPVYFISAGATILFLVFMDLPYAGSTLSWGLLDTAQISSALNKVPGVISGSIIAAAAVSLMVFLVKERWGKHQKKLAEDVIKETRRQLLSHWDFRPMNPLSNDAINRVIILFAALCLIAGLTVFTDFSQKQQSDSTDQLQTTEITDTDTNATKHNYVADRVSNKHRKDNRDNNASQEHNEIISVETNMTVSLESAEPEEEDISFTGYMFLLAVVLITIGITSHFDIGDKSLIESEYYYLLYHSLDPTWNPKQAEPFEGAKELRRADYFQVMSYLYSNGSTIKSEEREWHKLGAILTRLYNSSADDGKSGRAAFLSRMLYSFTEIKEQFSLNQGVKKDGEDLADRLRSRAIPVPEMLFSKEIIQRLDSIDVQPMWNAKSKDASASATHETVIESKENYIKESIILLLPTPEICDSLRNDCQEIEKEELLVYLLRLSRLKNEAKWNTEEMLTILADLDNLIGITPSDSINTVLCAEKRSKLKEYFEELLAIQKQKEEASVDPLLSGTGDGSKLDA